MSLIDDIKEDMAAGTPGPWVRSMGPNVDVRAEDPKTGQGIANTMGFITTDRPITQSRKEQCRANARRIARVPDMEAALLAAEELAGAVDQMSEVGCQQSVVRLQGALAAYRKATEDRT